MRVFIKYRFLKCGFFKMKKAVKSGNILDMILFNFTPFSSVSNFPAMRGNQKSGSVTLLLIMYSPVKL